MIPKIFVPPLLSKIMCVFENPISKGIQLIPIYFTYKSFDFSIQNEMSSVRILSNFCLHFSQPKKNKELEFQQQQNTVDTSN